MNGIRNRIGNRTGNRRTVIALAVTAAAVAGGVSLAVLPASADGNATGNGNAGHDMSAMTSMAMPGSAGWGDDSITTQSGSGGGSGSGSGSGDRGKPAVYFAASLNGANEVPVANGPAVGDKDGKAVEFLKIQGNQVSFAMKWKGIAPPTAAHIHQGAAGSNGGVKIPFFAEKLPGSVYSVTGSVTVDDAKLLSDLRANPGGFYANLHTAEFPGGAVRGQLHRLSSSIDFSKALSDLQASVVKGQQIYACTKQPGGGYAFTQDNVKARLGAGIEHSFVRPAAGPPQWIAPDGSAVTGAVLTKTPNGQGNIPELDLRATQSGKRDGVLAGTQEILRLNTVGGVAPAGSCDPYKTPRVGVDYRADYLFIGR
ncbi:CHRD domain-containing protein [Streptomyces fildesensis]|uniref:CHRD domain-containing protein n=1 Tax=Streptomyces fildesensis TaxID=375757 RepID=A0ABW8C256_9ACTN